MTKLTTGNLGTLDPRIEVPAYDRTDIQAGIAHLGVGGFHRAHQAVYVDRLFTAGLSRDWGIVGIGLMPQDVVMRDALSQQDHLYTVMTKHADGTVSAHVIASIIDYLFAPDDPEAVLSVLADPAIRIVSLTITEGGYHADQTTGELVIDDALRADLVPGAQPRTAFGFLVEALSRRRLAGVAAFSVVSCDNIQGNGSLARRMVTSFARLRDPNLGAWIDSHVAFPNSMVDRITPVTTDADRGRLFDEFGIQDAWPVVCEQYSQWVVEDDFPGGRPDFEAVGVQIVPDVLPYELCKLRLLNASHQALAYLGYLCGYRYVHEAAQDPLFVEFLSGYMEHEATPTLQPVPGLGLGDYRASVLERFANPEVRDTLARICADTSDRIPKFLLPVIHHQLASDGEYRRAALVVASWARYAEAVDEAGSPIDVVDQRRDALLERASRNHSVPLAFLEDESLFGDLHSNRAFTAVYLEALGSLHRLGTRATLESWLARIRDEPATTEAGARGSRRPQG